MAQQYGNLSGTVTEWKGAIGIAVSNANVQIITSLNDTLGTVVVGGRTRQTLWSAVQMLTQKLCCQTIHDCPKVVPLHYESE